MDTVKILAIDGGGIRGIIPATILAEIEKITDKPISELFDFIAGTSTGGILALGLTKPGDNKQPQYKAKDLIQLYEEEGSKIFDLGIFKSFDGILDKFSMAYLQMIAKRKYPSRGVEEVLAKYFGATRLSEALNEVLITSYDIEKRKPYFFKRYQAINSPGYDFPMKFVARATSAAPTYFEPTKLQSSNNSYHALVDGGVFANNPAMCAYAEAKRLHPEAKILVVSVGTGELVNRIPYKEAKGWGLIQWAPSILDITFDGVSDSVDYQLQQLLNDDTGFKQYYRFQSDRLEHGDHIDDTRPSNLKALQDLAEGILDRQAAELKALCRQLTQVKVAA